MPRLAECEVGGHPEPWAKLGLNCANEYVFIDEVKFRFSPDDAGFLSWTFASPAFTGETKDAIDGVTTYLVSQPHLVNQRASDSDLHKVVSTLDDGETLGGQFVSPSGVQILGLDHLVLMTDDLDRTSAEVERVLGVQCSRVRDAGNSVMQAFHKLDNTIIEIVSGPHVKHHGTRLWGCVVTVDDIDAWCTAVGTEVASPPRTAVQPGRYITTVRESVGLGVAVAVMSPHVKVPQK
jgi:predicted enzyme related to lactoylglutathione lyase